MPTLKSYLTGFITSVALTLAAYFVVVNHVVSGSILIFVILGLAMVQLVVQLIFFLHINQGADRRWNLVVLLSTVSIILILVIGSVWIMNHLNYNMSPKDINNYMDSHDGI